MTNEHDYVWSHPEEIGKHPGKYIAVVGKEIVSVTDDGKRAYEEARKKHPDRDPLVMYVPEANEMFLL